MTHQAKPTFYVFIDESGDFNFSPTGTKYFTLTALSAARPFPWEGPLTALKYDLIETRLNLEYFHATEDRQQVRNQVFEIIGKHLAYARLDSVIVEKRKPMRELQSMEQFYSRMLGYLIRHVLSELAPENEQIVIVTDRIPVRAKRTAVEKAIKAALATMLPAGSSYFLLHHDSKSCGSLQVVDYCNWAIYRKWKDGDLRSYDVIAPAIQSEVQIFRKEQWYYYRWEEM